MENQVLSGFNAAFIDALVYQRRNKKIERPPMARRHRNQTIRPDSVRAEDLEAGIDVASIFDRQTFHSNLRIQVDDISGTEIQELLKLHLNEVSVGRPAENVYAFGSERLCSSDVTFWSIWDNENIAGCGALLELSHKHGEIKSV
jgi:hypothetical protein